MTVDPQLYVTRDGRYEYRRLPGPGRAALVIRFHAPLDSILRRLDGAYIAATWTSVRSILEAHEIDPGRFVWGAAHPGQVDGMGHRHPPRPILETLGWLAQERTRGEFAGIGSSSTDPGPLWHSVAAHLDAADPPLCLAHDYYRAQRITRRGGELIASDDGDTALDIMRVDSTDCPIEWALFDPSKRELSWEAPEGPPEAPWMRLGQAMFERDEVAIVDAMDAVRSEYTAHGARICLESAARWLMIGRPEDP